MTFKDEEVEEELTSVLDRIKETVEDKVEEAIDKAEEIVEKVSDKVEDILDDIGEFTEDAELMVEKAMDVKEVAEIVLEGSKEAYAELEEDWKEVEEFVSVNVEKFKALRNKVETGVHIQDKAVKAILLELLELLDA